MTRPTPGLRLAAAAALSAVLLRAVPDLQLPAQLLPLAFLPALLAPLGASTRGWALSGAAFGAVYSAGVLFGLAKWGLFAAALFWLGLTALFVAVWILAGAVAARVAGRDRPLVLPLVWGLVAFALDEWIYGAVLLAAPSAPHSAWLRGLAAWAGCPLSDAIVLSCGSLLVLALRGGAPRRRASAAAVLSLLLLAPGPGADPGAGAQAEFLVVQPAIHWRRLAASGWSLEVRQQVEDQLDRLTREAVARGPGTIVWPENGNGLPNHLLPRRVRLLGAMLDERHDLLLGGPDFVAAGQAQAVIHLDATGTRGRAHKAQTVPWIERDLQPGAPTVFATLAGPVGVAVCFDILFGRHARALAGAGAESIAVTTDDASFGASTLASWHWGYAVFHAAEVGRSLVYASNSGPSGAMDAVRGEVEPTLPAGVAATAALRVGRSGATSPAVLGGRYFAALLAAGLLLTSLRRRPAERPADRVAAPALLWLAPPIAAIAIEAGYTPRVLGLAPARWHDDVRERLALAPALDFIGPLFRQAGEQSCGAATLAFALTTLGDLVFEDGVLRALGDPDAELSLAQLATVARDRGFSAEAYHAASLDDLRLGAGELAIVHLRRRHFVAVWGVQRERATLFDASHGAIFSVERPALEAEWTGYALIVRHQREPPLGAPARPGAPR